jgi:hypothetical protein
MSPSSVPPCSDLALIFPGALRQFVVTEIDRLPRARIVLATVHGDVTLGWVRPGAACDLALVDALLRLHLLALGRGAAIRLEEVHPRLRELLDLVGMCDRLRVLDR